MLWEKIEGFGEEKGKKGGTLVLSLLSPPLMEGGLVAVLQNPPLLEDVGSLYIPHFIYIIQFVIPICFMGLGGASEGQECI